MLNLKKITIFVLLIAFVFSLVSCGLIYMPNNEEKALGQLLPKLFTALDSGNEEAVYNLFSPSVREQSDNLKDQISLLANLYSGPTDEYDYENIGIHSKEHIGKPGNWASANATIPVRSGDKYYWFYIDLMYENFDESQVGITQLEFYTADERCAFIMSENKKTERSGLYLHAEKALGGEVRTIDGRPYRYTDVTRNIYIAEVKEFLKTSHSFSEFEKRFGKPNAEDIYHYYELEEENGEPRYLCIGDYDDDGTIYIVSIVDDFKYIKTVWELED